MVKGNAQRLGAHGRGTSVFCFALFRGAGGALLDCVFAGLDFAPRDDDVVFAVELAGEVGPVRGGGRVSNGPCGKRESRCAVYSPLGDLPPPGSVLLVGSLVHVVVDRVEELADV